MYEVLVLGSVGMFLVAGALLVAQLGGWLAWGGRGAVACGLVAVGLAASVGGLEKERDAERLRACQAAATSGWTGEGCQGEASTSICERLVGRGDRVLADAKDLGASQCAEQVRFPERLATCEVEAEQAWAASRCPTVYAERGTSAPSSWGTTCEDALRGWMSGMPADVAGRVVGQSHCDETLGASVCAEVFAMGWSAAGCAVDEVPAMPGGVRCSMTPMRHSSARAGVLACLAQRSAEATSSPNDSPR